MVGPRLVRFQMISRLLSFRNRGMIFFFSSPPPLSFSALISVKEILNIAYKNQQRTQMTCESQSSYRTQIGAVNFFKCSHSAALQRASLNAN